MASSERRRKPNPPRPSAKRGRARGRGRRLIRLAIIAGGSLTVLFLLAVAGFYALARIPEPSDIAAAQSVTVVDREGKQVGRIHAEADRVSIPLDRVPDHAREAVIAVEDRRFYSHPGVSVASIVRAAFANALSGGISQGGSTITQQYVKNAYVGRERTFLRKTREAVLALKLERQRSKDEILELYLNTIYFGRGAYGIEAASQTYFGRSARRLTVEQAALLAGLIRSPEAYDPLREPEEAKARRDTVIRLMREQGYLSDREAEDAREAAVRVRPRAPGGIAPHYLEEVRRFLERELGAKELYSGDVRVVASLDADMQRAAVDAVRAVYDRRRDPEAALVAVDPETGAVRAMVGARDFATRQLNLALRRRQPGSTFKPFVLSAAVAERVSPEDRFPAPAKRVFETDGGPWPVNNYDRRDHGTLTLSRATELSVNTVYARVILKVGAEDVAEKARRMGIRSRLDPVPSLALGTLEVTPLEMASAYATLAARGSHSDPYLVERVERKGRVLYRAKPDPDAAMERNEADLVNDVLQGVITDGTGTGAAIGRPAAGKTGTTDNFKDAWFAGYTPDLATVVWNGFPDGKRLLGVRGRNVTGGSFPAQMWSRFMRAALQDVAPRGFPEPEPIEPSDDESSPRQTRDETSRSPAVLPTQTPTQSKRPEKSPTGAKKTKSPSPSPSVDPSGSPSPSP